MRTLLLALLATAGTASAQIVLPANPSPANNGLSAGGGLFLDLSAACNLTVTHLRTASSAAAGGNFTVEVFTRSGSALGGPVGAGPGSSPVGWTSIGVAAATQGPVANDISNNINIPDIFVPAGTTVGVALLFTGVGPRYFGTGTAPIQTFTDGNLTLETGDARSAPFTTTGSFFSSRGLVGELTYQLGADVGQIRVTDCLPGQFIDISGTGTPLSLSDDGSVDLPLTWSNRLLTGTVRVGSNGGVRFCGTSTSLSFVNTQLPGSFVGSQALLPFWDDVNTGSGANGQIYWQVVGSLLIVQWENVAFFGSPLSDRATFQVQVPASGAIYAQFLYEDIDSARADGGSSATIGYQAGDIGDDAQYTFNAIDAVRDGTVLSVVEAGVMITPLIAGNYVDISGTGTPLNLSDDQEIDIPTTIGNGLLPSGVVRVGSNGGLRFNGTALDLAFGNGAIPSGVAFGGEQTLLPFWDDINTGSGVNGQVYWQEVGGRLIVQWENVAFFGGPLNERATFQVQVNNSGPVFAQFLYANVSSPRADGGGSATIGYQSGGFATDSMYSFNYSGAVNNGTVLSLISPRLKVGANFCSPNANSTGASTLLRATGTTSVIGNNLVLVAENMPPNAFGYFLVSRDAGFVANPGGSQGNLCLGGNIGRGVGLGVLNSGGSGSVTSPAMLNSLPSPGGPVAAVAGDTWNFQCWHRDSVGGIATSNLSNGLQIQTAP